LDKYIGRYRVVCELCRKTLKPHREDTYIYCANGAQIYRFSQGRLVYYRPGRNQSNSTIKKLTAMGIEGLEDYSTSEDMVFHFSEQDIDLVAGIFKARTLGTNIKPTSKRNLHLFDWYRKLKNHREKLLYCPNFKVIGVSRGFAPCELKKLKQAFKRAHR
jgi:hypothetical protein